MLFLSVYFCLFDKNQSAPSTKDMIAFLEHNDITDYDNEKLDRFMKRRSGKDMNQLLLSKPTVLSRRSKNGDIDQLRIIARTKTADDEEEKEKEFLEFTIFPDDDGGY